VEPVPSDPTFTTFKEVVPDKPKPKRPLPPRPICGRNRPFMGLMPGWRPLVHVDRTHLDTDLELEGDGGLDLSFVAAHELAFSVSASYVPMEEEDTGRDVDCFWLDAGLGVGGGPPVWDRGPVLYATAGPSFFVMHGEGGAPDMIAFGGFGRAGVGYCWGRLGLEVFGDIHGWLGGDSDDAQAAWAASLGVSASLSF
jgi:hypothetical protein